MHMFHSTSSQASNIPPSVSAWKAFKHRIGRDPLNDWMLILFLSVVLIIISVIVSINLYFSAQGRIDDSSANQDAFQVSIIKPDSFTKVLSDFSDRAKKYAGILHGYTGPRDPSM